MPSKSTTPAIFVRGLSYTLNDEEFANHFSDIAPVKRAFIVRDRTTHESRGYGFVQLCVRCTSGRADDEIPPNHPPPSLTPNYARAARSRTTLP